MGATILPWVLFGEWKMDKNGDSKPSTVVSFCSEVPGTISHSVCDVKTSLQKSDSSQHALQELVSLPPSLSPSCIWYMCLAGSQACQHAFSCSFFSPLASCTVTLPLSGSPPPVFLGAFGWCCPSPPPPAPFLFLLSSFRVFANRCFCPCGLSQGEGWWDLFFSEDKRF